ncbi:MAG: VIT1/CCC1 transporter family protein [Actinobacteria bacterium]|nr:VIT1/CCC1 transporter family protein [Actinomycetota bacterium]
MVRHDEFHLGNRIDLLRATVLGANDGIISTACLILAVTAADASRGTIITAGVAGLVAGAASMAIGEYVSVSAQRDAEQADIAKETWELAHTPEHELDELTAIYVAKGLNSQLARDVAVELTNKDALKAHLAEELGISQANMARPLQAGVSSASSFSVGSAVPLIAVANIQLATCTPNFLILETIQGWQGFHSQVVKTSIKFENGFIIPPTEPGLGIELNEEVALAHPYTGSELHLEMSALPATLL